MNYDLVYIYTMSRQHGSRWENNELRYSLRSLINANYRNVVIVGDKPDWVENVKYIPCRDITSNKQLNALHKIKTACQSRKIGSDFYLMNDDFFFINKVDEITYQHGGNLKKRVENFVPKYSKYYYAMKRTAELFEDPLDYELHIPIKFNKKKFLNLFRKYEMGNCYLFRSVYGNEYKVGGTERKDCKVYNVNDFYKLNKTDYMSTSPDSILRPAIQGYIEKLFPKPSIYEKN